MGTIIGERNLSKREKENHTHEEKFNKKRQKKVIEAEVDVKIF